MQIIETYCHGKSLPELNEDFLVATEDFVLVIDGATDQTGRFIEEMRGGRFVAKTIADFHSSGCVPADIEFGPWVDLVANRISEELDRAGWPKDVGRPAASVILYSRARRQIFRVGDCHFRFDGITNHGGKGIDDLHASIRSNHLKARILDGASVEELLARDTGRDLIVKGLKHQYRHANAWTGMFAYPIFDGKPVPEYLLEKPFDVPEGVSLVMTSDGFDFPQDTLIETLMAQAASYSADPLRIGVDGARGGTKGLVDGMKQHDDQTFVSFRT